MGKIVVQVQKFRPTAILPTYSDEGNAGMDVFSATTIVIPKGKTVLIPTGLKFHIPIGCEIQVRPKNTINPLNIDLVVSQMPGTLNYGDFSEFAVVATNETNHAITVNEGQIIAQIVLMAIPRIVFEEIK